MKTLLVFLLLAVTGVAFYFYHNPRAVSPQPVSPAVASIFPVEPASPEPAVVDDRPLMAILRERCTWPFEVALTRPHKVNVPDGEMTLPVGRKLRMTALTDDGMLQCRVADVAVAIPFDGTNFLDVLPAEPAAAAPAPVARPATAVRPSPVRPATEQALAAIKARFPTAEKRKAVVLIRNANQTSRHDTVELQIPKPDVLSRYRGWVMAASPSSLPAVVEKLDAQLAKDIADLRGQYGSVVNQSANAEAYHTHLWLTGPMRSYIAQLRQIAGSRR